jgi:hypothetical protein
MLECLLLGDSLATYEGLGRHFNCHIQAEVGRHTAEVLQTDIPRASVVIISLGSNDPPNSALRENLLTLRSRISFPTIVLWVVPAERLRAMIVEGIAERFADALAYFVPGPDGVHPSSYSSLATSIREELPFANL